jgi:hypothetical protein
MTFWCGSGSGSGKLFCLLLFEGTFTSFVKDKKSNRSHKTVGIKVFFYYYFCLLIVGSGSGAGSIPLNNGSGSRRPKNMWIRWIQIWIWNTASHDRFLPGFLLKTLAHLNFPLNSFLFLLEGAGSASFCSAILCVIITVNLICELY